MAIGAGEYFIRVQRESGESPYELGTWSNPIPDTASASKFIGEIEPTSGGFAFSDYVGRLDPVDFFRLKVKTACSIGIKICSLESSATIEAF